MSLDPQHVTLLVLGARDQALSSAANALTARLTGDPANDNSILQELQQISAERFAIASRRMAITGGGTFSAPSNGAVTALQVAINNLHAAVVASANTNQLIVLTTQLLQQFGAGNT